MRIRMECEFWVLPTMRRIFYFQCVFLACLLMLFQFVSSIGSFERVIWWFLFMSTLTPNTSNPTKAPSGAFFDNEDLWSPYRVWLIDRRLTKAVKFNRRIVCTAIEVTMVISKCLQWAFSLKRYRIDKWMLRWLNFFLRVVSSLIISNTILWMIK